MTFSSHRFSSGAASLLRAPGPPDASALTSCNVGGGRSHLCRSGRCARGAARRAPLRHRAADMICRTFRTSTANCITDSFQVGVHHQVATLRWTTARRAGDRHLIWPARGCRNIDSTCRAGDCWLRSLRKNPDPAGAGAHPPAGCYRRAVGGPALALCLSLIVDGHVGHRAHAQLQAGLIHPDRGELLGAYSSCGARLRTPKKKPRGSAVDRWKIFRSVKGVVRSPSGAVDRAPGSAASGQSAGSVVGRGRPRPRRMVNFRRGARSAAMFSACGARARARRRALWIRIGSCRPIVTASE